MSKQEKKVYISPQIRIVEIEVEAGYATSSYFNIQQDFDRIHLEMNNNNGSIQVDQYDIDSHWNWGF